MSFTQPWLLLLLGLPIALLWRIWQGGGSFSPSTIIPTAAAAGSGWGSTRPSRSSPSWRRWGS